MADQQVQSVGSGYERLGEAKLSLVDVLAQSVGFMGPVFSRGVHHPADHRRELRRPGRGNLGGRSSVLLAAVGVFAIGWIVAQYARRIHAAGSLYDYVSEGLGKTIGAAAGWLYYAGTIILTVGPRRAARRVHQGQPADRVRDRPRPADLALGRGRRAPAVRRALPRRADLDAGAARAGSDLDRRGAGLLRDRDRQARRRQRHREGASTRAPTVDSRASCSASCTGS